MISKNQIKFVKQLELKKYRKREGLFVAEGPKVVGDLLHCGYHAELLYATDEWKGDTAFTPVSQDELCKLSFLQHPQEVLGVFRIPDVTMNEVSKATAGANGEVPEMGGASLALALDGIQDPGNLGTIIRIADWYGIATVYCSEDTVDAWGPKVVQATMGSIARVHILYCDLLQLLSTTRLPVYGTLLDGENIYTQPLTDTGIVVMGNEGNGISEPVRRLVGKKLLIPSFSSGAESLNVAVATAIVCSEFRRKRFV